VPVFVDLHLFKEEKARSREELFEQYASNIQYAKHLHPNIKCYFIQHASFSAQHHEGNTTFLVKHSKRYNLFTLTFLFFEIRALKPEVVMLHGFLQPLRILLARLVFSSGTTLWIQNHADVPASGIRLLFQKWAGRYIRRFLIVSNEQSLPWFQKGIFNQNTTITEVMEGSTTFRFMDKREAKSLLGNSPSPLFLWVGRLDANKDPLTVVKAFAEYSRHHRSAKLWMVYHGGPLEQQVKEFIITKGLTEQIVLKGYVPHKDLENLYRAADYFLATSHSEGSGYALCEAMCCGCVPVVSDIPSFRKMTKQGECGVLFPVGNVEVLYTKLMELREEELLEKSKKVQEQFLHQLSFEAIAGRISTALLTDSLE